MVPYNYRKNYSSQLTALGEKLEDKWGPAVGIKIEGKFAKKRREENGWKGKKGDVFYFGGTVKE